MEIFKTLIFTDEIKKRQGKYARIVSFLNEANLGGSDIPEILTINATMKKLKKIYPRTDFSGTKLIKIQILNLE